MFWGSTAQQSGADSGHTGSSPSRTSNGNVEQQTMAQVAFNVQSWRVCQTF